MYNFLSFLGDCQLTATGGSLPVFSKKQKPAIFEGDFPESQTMVRAGVNYKKWKRYDVESDHKMRILILGVNGMLGHALWQGLKDAHETYGTTRKDIMELNSRCRFFFDSARIIDKLNVRTNMDLDRIFGISEPEIVINCIGIIKQLPEANDPVKAININALIPHILAIRCSGKGIRLIHISTDCVFSGEKGNYSEEDIPDAEDIYGKTKFLGEVSGNNCLTIRTSLIGRELTSKNGLLEWFLSQRRRVAGYRKAIFSGLTTYALSNIIKTIIEKHGSLAGLYHISSEPITKYDLLKKLKQRLSLDVEIVPDDGVAVDRSLNSIKFRKATGIDIPLWDTMLDGLAEMARQYDAGGGE